MDGHMRDQLNKRRYNERGKMGEGGRGEERYLFTY